MAKATNFLLYGAIGAAAIYAASKITTGLSLQKLKFYRPRVKFGKITLTNIELVITIDIENPGSRDVNLDYFTGDLFFNSKRLSSFTFNSNQQVILKSRQITTVPFTVIVSNLSAVSVIANLLKTISNNTPLAAIIGVTGTIYAGGNNYDVAFNYDVKKQAVAGIAGRRRNKRRKAVYQAAADSPYQDQPAPVAGIGRVESMATLSEEIENYFASTVSPGPKDRQAYAAEFQKITDYLQRLTKSFGDVKISVAANEIRFKYNQGKGFARIALDPVRKAILVPKLKAIVRSSVAGIAGVKATLEFSSNSEMEKYFTGKRVEKKIMFSKN